MQDLRTVIECFLQQHQRLHFHIPSLEAMETKRWDPDPRGFQREQETQDHVSSFPCYFNKKPERHSLRKECFWFTVWGYDLSL